MPRPRQSLICCHLALSYRQSNAQPVIRLPAVVSHSQVGLAAKKESVKYLAELRIESQQANPHAHLLL